MAKCAKSWHTPRRFLNTSSTGVATVVARGSNLKSRKIRALRSTTASSNGRSLVNEAAAYSAKIARRVMFAESKRNSPTSLSGVRRSLAQRSRTTCHEAVRAGSGNPGDSLRAVVRLITRSGVAALAFFIVICVGSLGVGCVITFVWKIFDPSHVGLWIGGQTFALGVVDDAEGAQERIGNWIFPLMIGVAALSWLICRWVLIWAVRTIAPRD